MGQEHPPSAACIHKLDCSDRLDLLAMHHAWPDRYPFLLESLAEADSNASAISRYDLLMATGGEYLALQADGRLESNHAQLAGQQGFLDALNLWQSEQSPIATESPLPFIGGWFLYLGYELAAEIEPRLSLPAADSCLPTALAVRCPAAIIHDKQSDAYWLVAESETALHQLQTDLRALDQQAAGYSADSFPLTHLQEEAPGQYLRAVERIKEYVLAGDVFQVNLSRGWQAAVGGNVPDAQIYSCLKRANPAPFAGLMKWRENTVFSSSPERLVETRGRKVQTRPIAGTRPRSRGDATDQHERDALVGHPKERAEHIMLIDLERNDLGRICEPGSVEVDELMVLESYAHVHHIVSNVSGRLREKVPAGDVIRAVFPGGTITGCPKVRCMEIIAELESTGRGYYTGAMGYLDRRGHMDLNILIRCLERQGNRLGFRTGAGIVADSVPDNELQETRAKARGLLRALNVDPDYRPTHG